MRETVYLIGSLRNPYIPNIAHAIREAGFEVFDDWHAAGPAADDCWRGYEMQRGRSYAEALDGHAATKVFEFDQEHLIRSHIAVLAMPAGKSAHLELGWMLGQGKRGYVLLDQPGRWDVMYKFADGVFGTIEELVAGITKGQRNETRRRMEAVYRDATRAVGSR